MDYSMYQRSGQKDYLARDVVDYMLEHRKPTEPDGLKEMNHIDSKNSPSDVPS